MKLKVLLSKLVLLIQFFLLNPVILTAQQPGDDEGTIIPVKKIGEDYKKHRPNSPSTQFIVCYYNNGVISLSFSESEGQCRGSVANLTTGNYQLITFDSSDLNVDIETGALIDFSIEFTTSHGNTYSGSTTN